jgi:drug/metabolite transporter (DMT)-like permease
MSGTRYDERILLALLDLIWGSNFIFMKWAAKEITPGQIALLRVVSGFLPILVTSLRGIEAVFNDRRAWIGLGFGLGLCGTGLADVSTTTSLIILARLRP